MAVLGGSACSTFGRTSDDEIIYRWKDGSLVTVYNPSKEWFTSEDISYLKKRDHKYGEFGGRSRDCSNDQYYCLGGGINVAIPKIIDGQTKWEFNDRYCTSESGLSKEEPNYISCRNMQYVSIFTYEVDRGVTSYFAGKDNANEYVLIGDRGLFSKGWQSAAKEQL